MNWNIVLIWGGLGLVVGIVAKFILPGKDSGGLITTSLTGILGAFIGGFIGNYFGLSTEFGELSLVSAATAIVGALVVRLFICSVAKRISRAL